MFPILVRYSLWVVGGWMLVLLLLLLAGPPEALSSIGAGTTQPANAFGNATGDKDRRPREGLFGVVKAFPNPLAVDELEKKPLHEFLESDVQAYVSYLDAKFSDPLKRVAMWAKKSVGQPYRAHVLGEFPFEMYDPDPLYCLQQADSTSFCEQVYALAFAGDWNTFMLLLQRLRYKDGLISLQYRNVDVATEWNDQNGWLFDDVCKSLGGGRQWVDLKFFWSPKDFLNHMRLASTRKEMERQDVYVPRMRVPNVLADLADGDLVQMVKGSEKRATINQMGIVVRAENGEAGMIYCAAPTAKQEPLLAYLQRDESILGMKFLRLRPFPEKLVAQELARTQVGPPRWQPR